MDKKITAIIAVVILIVAGIAVYFVVGGDDDKNLPSESSGLGTVYGNANGDCYINDDDLDIIQAIIDGDRDLKDFPMADLNHSGTVTDADYDLAKAIINKTAKTVDVIDINDKIVSVKYPMKSISVAGGTNVRSAIAVLGIERLMVANATNSYIDDVLDKTLVSLRENGTITKLTTGATDADFDTISKLSFETMICGFVVNGYATEENAKKLNDWGIGVIELNFSNDESLLSSITILGILTCNEDRANLYNELCKKVYSDVKEFEGDEYGKSTVLCVTMTNSVSGTLSDYYAATLTAGGNNLADWSDKTKKFAKGDTWLLDAKYASDCLFHFKSLSYSSAPAASDIENYLSYFENTEAYKNGGYYLINGVLPLPIRIAYMAELMYPEQFEDGWADSIHQYYIDTFIEDSDWDVSKDGKYYWTVE